VGAGKGSAGGGRDCGVHSSKKLSIFCGSGKTPLDKIITSFLQKVEIYL